MTEQTMRLSYLGPEGTFSGMAAEAVAPTGQLEPYETFGAVVEAAEIGAVDWAVVPVNNSTEGPVTAVYDLLGRSSLRVVGEVTLPIRHQLMGHVSIGGVKRVLGHAQALAQCREWLRENLPGVEQEAVTSNGVAARLAAAADPTKGVAAVAGASAAERYGIPIQAADIQDIPDNQTRFVVLGGASPEPTGNDKTMLLCTVRNEAGSLVNLLAPFAAAGLNLVDIVPRPVPERPGDLRFFLDVEGHAQDAALSGVLRELAQRSAEVRVLGSFPVAACVAPETVDRLTELRSKINGADEGIVATLKTLWRQIGVRAGLGRAIGVAKGDKPVHDPARERWVHERIRQLNGGVVDPGVLSLIYRILVTGNRQLQEEDRLGQSSPSR